MRHLWVVEMEIGSNWETVTLVGLTRSEARDRLIYWKELNPDDKFRIRKYVPEIKK